MDRRDTYWLIAIILIMAGVGWLIASPEYPLRRGLDLQGGLQVLLEADVPADQTITAEQMNSARQIIDQRVNSLGVTEPLVQVEGERRILVELPGIDNPEDAISLIQETALLEFVDTGSNSIPEGTCIRTDANTGPSRCELAPGQAPDAEVPNPAPTYPTVMTGAALQEATARTTSVGEHMVAFKLQPDFAQQFADYTRTHQGQFLTVVLDKEVISSPRINAVIDGAGTITGRFTAEEAQLLAQKLRFGSLPVPLRIESTRQIGATLGEISIQASIQAGAIGLSIVLLFMFIYYRSFGLLADLALVGYALINIAVYKGMPVTLTLPSITGFLLSTGMAVDANILVFERIKEELRKGSTLREAISTGFDRAWSSIRDANVATLVICMILWFFGRNFGASIVQGFAITLAIGVLISLFTAVIVTRTFVNLIIGRAAAWFSDRKWLLLGI